jgi:hypothetical protein
VRDILQIISFLISLSILVAILRRGRKYQEPARMWYTFIFISVLTLIYYVAVFIDLYVHDFMNSGDVSSMVRLATSIAILLFVIYAPHRNPT